MYPFYSRYVADVGKDASLLFGSLVATLVCRCVSKKIGRCSVGRFRQVSDLCGRYYMAVIWPTHVGWQACGLES